ncbi:MAG TPA: N-acetylmuramoyl-L-alanine amidase [Stellaceae bacterium]|jgi:N-acetylmuramoyl-L-alanine amidase|nr:N-acetylmuramoyl-L-alanine amidase [Stellaceae bacterium]
MQIVISSGHSKKVRGAAGVLDEVNEARLVVDRVAEIARGAGVGVKTFHDDTSATQNENLNTIVRYHNAQQRDLDVSVHFNAFQKTDKPMGTECLFVSQQALSARVAAGIARAGGLINRGAKKRDNLAFLNKTNKPAILIEVCFVDSSSDARLYRDNFDAICKSIAEVTGGVPIDKPAEPVLPAVFFTNITATMFGGKADPNKSAYEDRWITDEELGVALPYRWRGPMPRVVVVNNANGRTVVCEIVDVGPWNIDDPYWLTGARPQAETGTDKKGRKTNKAGIDLTPAAAKAIDLKGLALVDWGFVVDEPTS